jgi:hypothetical protein
MGTKFLRKLRKNLVTSPDGRSGCPGDGSERSEPFQRSQLRPIGALT